MSDATILGAALTAFLAGTLSFLSPCVMPLMPAYLSMVSGLSIDELRGSKLTGEGQHSHRVLLGSLSFIAGFSVIFVAGGASATAVGRFLGGRQLEALGHTITLMQPAGMVIFLFGLHLTGLIKIPWLYREKRLSVQATGSLVSTFLLGSAFAFGWTPCIGPVLAAIFTLAAEQESVGRGSALLLCYSLGLGLPFLLTALSLNRFFRVFASVKRHFRAVEIGSGILLCMIGLLVAFDQVTKLNQFFAFFGDLSLWLEEKLL